jgi:hypothetical protein
MPRPTSGTTIQRPDLGVIAYEYNLTASQRGFIGQQVMPVFDVPEKSADYPVIPIESLMKMPETKRAPRTGYNRGDYEFETDTYSCKEHGWEEPVDDTEAALYSRFFDAEEVAVMRATDILLRGHEKRVADAVMSTSNFSVATAATSWATPANATPKTDIENAQSAMRSASGLLPNVAVMSWDLFKKALKIDEIADTLQYTNPVQIMEDAAQRLLLAQYFGVSDVLVGNAMYDSNAKGKSFSLSNIWSGTYVFLGRVGGGRDLKQPIVGRTFLWTGDSPQIITTEQYRDDSIRSNIYRVRQHVDEEFIFTGAGYLLKAIL